MLKKTGNLNLSKLSPTSTGATSSSGRSPVYSSNNNSHQKVHQQQPTKLPRKNPSAPTTPQTEQSSGYLYCKQGPSGPGYYPAAAVSQPAQKNIGGSMNPTYYPLPGMANAFPAAGASKMSSNASATSTMTLPSGIVLEGEEEEL